MANANLEKINTIKGDYTLIINDGSKDWLSTVNQISNYCKNSVLTAADSKITNLTNLVNNTKNTLELDYYNKTTIDNKVQDIKDKTDTQIKTTLLHYVLWDDLRGELNTDTNQYGKGFIDEVLDEYFTKEDINAIITSSEAKLNTKLSDFYNKTNIDEKLSILSTAIENLRSSTVETSNINNIIINTVNTIKLDNYFTKDEIENKHNDLKLSVSNQLKSYVINSLTPSHITIKKTNDSDNPLEDGFITRYEHENDVQDIKQYIKVQISANLRDYVKLSNYNREIETFKKTINSTISTKFNSYYTKKEIDNKFEDIGKAYVQILSPREYQTLKAYGQIKDNNLYLIQKYGRPVELYIGKFLFAKRSDDTAIGFPYTFPLVF